MKKIVIVITCILLSVCNVFSQESVKEIQNVKNSLGAVDPYDPVDPQSPYPLSKCEWTSRPTAKLCYVWGNVGIGTLDPSHRLHVKNNGWKARFSGSDGYIDIGPANSGHAHIYTDRPNFIFNKDIYSITGGFSAYSTSNLFLKTNGSTKMTILKSNGNVGIGTSAPSYKLQTQGDIYANGGWLRVSGARGLYFQSYGGGFYMSDATWIRTYNNKSFYHNTGIMRTDGTFQVGPNGNRFVVKTNGNVGVGTTAPNHTLHLYGAGVAGGGSKIAFGDCNTFERANLHGGLNCLVGEFGTTDTDILQVHGKKGIKFTTGNYQHGVLETAMQIDSKHVIGATIVRINGTLIAQEMRCRTNVWSDFVFSDNYELKPLEEVQYFISHNKHLPGVPSESEVLEKGVNVAEMDAILLQKIEELTLYLIEQDQKIKLLESELSKIKKLDLDL